MYYDWALKWRKLYLTTTQYSIWPILLTSIFITQKVSVCMVNGIKNAQRNETMLAMVEKNEVKNKCFYRCVWNQVYNDDTKAKGRSIPVHVWK